MDIEADIKAMLVKTLAVEAEALVSEAHLQDDLGADSLMLMTLAGELEDKYKVSLSPDELLDVETVGDLLALMTAKVAT
jgi:acyl carrier protein